MNNGFNPTQSPNQEQQFSNWLDDFQTSADEVEPTYPNPSQGIGEQVNALPNSEKLTNTERWLYKTLPGFAESKPMQALGNFFESPAGKLLNVLDVFAEGAERTLGLIAQYRDMQPGDEFRLKDAWAAGGLFWDTARLPKLGRNERGEFGLRIEDGLPGAYAVTEARKMLQDGKSFEEVKGLLYDNLGALALRAQLQDTLGHVVVDPLNFMMAAIKPVQRIHAIRNLALTGKVDVEVMQTIEQAARLAGNIQEADKMLEAIDLANRSGKALTRFDRFAINLSGGVPYLKKTEKGFETLNVAKMTKGEKLAAKLNPFALTPQARASELLDMVAANVGEHLIRPNWNADPEEFIKALSGAARGSIGGEWGHLAGTIQGRTVQGILSNSDAVVKGIAQEWKAYGNERTLLQRLSSLIPNMDERKLWRMAKNDANGLFEQALKKANELGDVDFLRAVENGSITQKTFEGLGKIDNSIPLLREEFYTKALVSIQDVAMRQSIIQFGIKEKGVLTKWSDALKAWESLPFIKANPANAIRNLVNNDVTLVGRGLFGTLTTKGVDDFWKGKWIPPQFQRGFGLAGNETNAAGELVTAGDELFDPGNAIKALEEALTGKEGLADKVKDAAGRVDLKAFDFSKFSAKFETRASKRASTMGWMEFHQQYWNSKTGFTSISKHMDANTLSEMEDAFPGIAKYLDEIAESSGADSEKFATLMNEGLEHNTASVFKNTEEGLGFKLNDVMGADTIQRIQDGLPQAMKEGKVNEFLDGLRLEMENHVDEMFNQHVENLPGIVAAQVQAGGQMQFHRIFGKASDEFWAGNTEHAMRMSTINEAIDYAKSTKDYNKVRSMWNKIMTDGENHFGRVWKKFDAYQEGLKQGAKNAGIPYPEEVSSSFKEIRSGWSRFFDYRNKAYSGVMEGGNKNFDDIQKTLDTMHEALAKQEDELYRRIDDLMADSLPDPVMQKMYRNYRDSVGELRLADRKHTQNFYAKIRQASSEEAPALWSRYWSEKMARTEQIRQLEMRGSSAIQGDSDSVKMFLDTQAATTTEPTDVIGLANQYDIPTATKAGTRNNKRILNTVNKYLPEGTEKFKNVEDIPLDVAKQAFEGRKAEKAGQITQAAEKAFIPDAEKMFPDPMPIETIISELNYGRGYAAMDALGEEAIAQSGKVPRLVKDLDPKMQKKIRQWMKQVNNDMSSFRSAGVQYAAFRRDSALLNYNRRTNFDNFIGHGAPFAFWTTHSAINWVIYSVDRPAMLTSYFRSRQFFETAGLPDQNVPARMKGNIRVSLPFAPDWMGDTFVNPMRFMLPFDGFMMPWEQATTSKFKSEQKAERTLDQMLESGVITADQHREATETRSGDAWNMAMNEVKKGGEDYDAMDFVSMTMTPHAPLMWAYNAARGEKSEIGAFTPMTKNVKNLATMMGVEDWSNSPYNVEARIRKSMGLPAYDKWEDYRVQREISNMAADGGLDMEKVKEAMTVAALVESKKMTPEEAKEQSPLYKEAIKRSNIESGGWFFGALGGIVGIPVRSYPTGEQEQRELGEQFSAAMEQNDAGDPEALAKFFEDNPEYESRLALFKSPEDRLKNFMIDNMWSRWNELPKIHQDEIKEQLGDNFSNMFMNKETRNYEAIKPEQLQIWLALTKGKQIGKLSADTEAMLELNQLKLTDPETAWRVQTFYDARKSEFADFSKLQNGYYAAREGLDRKKYLAENPQLKEYWNFRRGWMEKNPDLVRFLTDDPKQLKKYENQNRNPDIATAPTAQELQAQMTPEMQELIQDWTYGQSLPGYMERYLEELANSYGNPEITPRTLAGILTGK